MKLELSYIQKTQQRKAWPQREGESTLTACHICHRSRIPFGHVLIELLCSRKHCKRGCNKEKKRPTHHKPQKRVRFKHTTTKENKTCEKCDPMKLELSYVQNTQQQMKLEPSERKREYTYCVPYLSPPPYSISTRPN